MKNFAKLWDDTPLGQVVVLLDEGDDGPVLRVYFQPEGFGVCSVGLGFEDSDTGWEAAERRLKKLSADDAVKLVEPTVKRLQELE